MTDWNGPQPAPKALWNFIHANFPTVRNLGIYNKRMVAGTNTPSHHAEGRALDLGLRAWVPSEKWLGDELFKIFIDGANPRDVDEIIWNRQIWSAQRQYIHVHHGQSPHIDHIHVGFTRAGSQRTSFAQGFIVKMAVLRTGMEDLGQTVGGSFSA